MQREAVLERLESVIRVNGHILIVATGDGMSFQFAVAGGTDLVLALNAGKIRQMGQSAFIGFFSMDSCNDMVYRYAQKEILPQADNFPVVFGLFMQDPCFHPYEYMKKIQKSGYSGVMNYPSIGFFDGKFRSALENADLGYDKEVEGIRIAHFLNLFTIAYVFDVQQAIQMCDAGADAICIHFGITGGGMLGASQVMTLDKATKLTKEIFDAVEKHNPKCIRLICGGPVLTPIDARSFYQTTRTQGFIGGSSLERIPLERAMINTVRAFKSHGNFDESDVVTKVLNGDIENTDYVEFMLAYIESNYNKKIRLKDLAVITYMSTTRLSILFKEKTGLSFSQYLVNYRMDKAVDLIEHTRKQMKQISIAVGYEDYTQFCKMFRKVKGVSPTEYREKL